MYKTVKKCVTKLSVFLLLAVYLGANASFVYAQQFSAQNLLHNLSQDFTQNIQQNLSEQIRNALKNNIEAIQQQLQTFMRAAENLPRLAETLRNSSSSVQSDIVKIQNNLSLSEGIGHALASLENNLNTIDVKTEKMLSAIPAGDINKESATDAIQRIQDIVADIRVQLRSLQETLSAIQQNVQNIISTMQDIQSLLPGLAETLQNLRQDFYGRQDIQGLTTTINALQNLSEQNAQQTINTIQTLIKSSRQSFEKDVNRELIPIKTLGKRSQNLLGNTQQLLQVFHNTATHVQSLIEQLREQTTVLNTFALTPDILSGIQSIQESLNTSEKDLGSALEDIQLVKSTIQDATNTNNTLTRNPFSALNYNQQTGIISQNLIDALPKIPCPKNPQCDPAQIKTIGDMIEYLFAFSLFMIGIVVFLNIIYGGVLYLTSGGAPAKKAAGMERIKNSFYGLIILFAAWLILNTINPDLINNTFDISPIPSP